jgi:hypothetical protein
MSETANDNYEAELSQYLAQFEAQGATLSYPVLDEGNYKGNITDISVRANKATPKTGPRAGVEGVIINWQVMIALESEIAQQKMKRDGDVIVRADQDCINVGKASLNANNMGITYDNNISFWNFIGAVFEQAGLASKVKDDTGASTYVLDKSIIGEIYKGTVQEYQNLIGNPETELMLVPAKLAEFQMKNIKELITSEADTRRCYVHVARRTHYRDKQNKEHFVKQIIFPGEFEAIASNMESLVL